MHDSIINPTTRTTRRFVIEIDPDFDCFASDSAEDDFMDRHLLALSESLSDQRNV
jgi:hypothetical protein